MKIIEFLESLDKKILLEFKELYVLKFDLDKVKDSILKCDEFKNVETLNILKYPCFLIDKDNNPLDGDELEKEMCNDNYDVINGVVHNSESGQIVGTDSVKEYLLEQIELNKIIDLYQISLEKESKRILIKTSKRSIKQ